LVLGCLSNEELSGASSSDLTEPKELAGSTVCAVNDLRSGGMDGVDMLEGDALWE
jgi:hypothetical protein